MSDDFNPADFPADYKAKMIAAYPVIAELTADEAWLAHPAQREEAFERVLAAKNLRSTHEQFLDELNPPKPPTELTRDELVELCTTRPSGLRSNGMASATSTTAAAWTTTPSTSQPAEGWTEPREGTGTDMTDPTDIRTRAKELLDGITPGPWAVGIAPGEQNCEYPDITVCAGGDAYRVVCDFASTKQDRADAEFIAAAPTLVHDLLRLVQRLRADDADLTDSYCRVRDERDVALAEIDALTAERDAALAEVERLTPREITTVEDLDALPEGSIVLDSDGPPCPWELSDDAWWAPGDGQPHHATALALPARVLWTPEEAGR